MPIVQAKCTNCGANLQVDSLKDAAICPYCNTPYIVEQAINNFSGNNYGAINASVVNFFGNSTSSNPSPKAEKAKEIVPSEFVLQKMKIADQFRDATNGGFFLKSDGTLGLLRTCGHNSFYDGSKDNSVHIFDTLDLNVFLWKRLKRHVFLALKTQYKYGGVSIGSSGAIMVGLTYDGECLVSNHYCLHGNPKDGGWSTRLIEKKDSPYYAIRSWKNIVKLCILEPDTVIGLAENGRVFSAPEIPELSQWKDITNIIVDNHLFTGITKEGKVVVADTVYSYERQNMEDWHGIIDVFRNYGLRKDGRVISASWDAYNVDHLEQVASIRDGVAILADGSLRSLSSKSEDDQLKKLGKGYIQKRWSNNGDLFLSAEGRVDRMTNTGVIFRGEQTGIVSLGITKSGYLVNPNGVRIFWGDPANYGKEISEQILDQQTKEKLQAHYKERIKEEENRRRGIGWFTDGVSKTRLIKSYTEYWIQEYRNRLNIISKL